MVLKKWRVSDPILWDLPALIALLVSAFAARRATRQTNGDIRSQNEAQTSRVTETCNESEETTRPVRKKQKRGIHTTKRPQQADGFVNLQNGSLQDGAKDIESDCDDRSLSLSGPETGVLSTSPIQRLSTFNPTRSKVLSETENDWTVRLHPNDVSTWPIGIVCGKL